jgi:uncharacterized protein (TIGR02453 family)
MAETRGMFSQDIFRFFREMGLNNHKPWMDANRERYRSTVVEPFRALLERLAPAARQLNSQFVTSGRVGDNFARINRDIRFARDKSPYRTQMYLFFAEPGGEGGQLYVGISAETATCGFRIYSSGRTSSLIEIARPRGKEHAQWIEGQKRRLRKKYESYWYSTEKSEWTKHNGWPAKLEEWKKLQAWIVRKRFEPAAVTRRGFERKVAKIFQEVYPLYPFTTSPKWKP